MIRFGKKQKCGILFYGSINKPLAEHVTNQPFMLSVQLQEVDLTWPTFDMLAVFVKENTLLFVHYLALRILIMFQSSVLKQISASAKAEKKKTKIAGFLYLRAKERFRAMSNNDELKYLKLFVSWMDRNVSVREELVVVCSKFTIKEFVEHIARDFICISFENDQFPRLFWGQRDMTSLWLG